MNKERIWTLLSRKLAGEATASELAELDQTLAQSALDQNLAATIQEFWDTATENNEDYLEATYHLHLQRLKQKGFDLEVSKEEFPTASYLNIATDRPSYNHKKRLWLVASVLILLLSSVFFLVQRDRRALATASVATKPAVSEVSTKNGSRTKIQLPDGSEVWLNGSSKLVYDNKHFGESLREVSLTGEGYFDVVKNPEKPFIIHTTKMDIRVVGTAFNVRCYPGERNTETSLIRGSIEVTLKDRKEKIMLKPSEKLVVSNNDGVQLNNITATTTTNKPGKIIPSEPMILLKHLTRMPTDSSIVETAWVENRLVFSGERFEDVAFKMEKWYGVSIRFTNESLKNEPLTATFDKETVNEALHALQFTTRFTYKNNSNTIILSK